MALRLFKAIEEYNNQKQRDDQRPKWGLHMTEAHVLAIADTPVPPDLAQEAAAAKAKAMAILHRNQVPILEDLQPHLPLHVLMNLPMDHGNLQHHHPEEAVGKTTAAKVAAATRIVAETGTILEEKGIAGNCLE